MPFPAEKITDEAQAKDFLTDYNSTAEEVWNTYSEASWAYNTDINEANKQTMVRLEFSFGIQCIRIKIIFLHTDIFYSKQLQKNLEMAKHTKDYGLKARKYDTTDFQDASVKRILKKLSDLERAALPDAELIEVQNIFVQTS